MEDQRDIAAEITAELKKQGIVAEEATDVAKKETVAEVLPKSAEVLPEFAEAEAMKKGWKPDGPKSAEEFLRAEPLYEEIKKRGKELKDVRSQVDELVKMVSAMRKAGYEEKLEVIKQERAQAIARSDIDSVDYLDDQLYQVKNELQKEVAPHPEVHPAAQQFVDKYKDVLKDPEVASYVQRKDIALGNDPDVVDPYDHMKKLEEQLFKKYPDRFPQIEKTEVVMAVESDSRPVTAKRKTKYSFSDLNHDQKEIYKYMEKTGDMAGEDYIKKLADAGLIQ